MKYLFTLMLATIMMSGVLYSQNPPDPGVLGSDSTAYLEYNLGDTILPSWEGDATEVIGRVHFPIDLSDNSRVLLFMHGRHGTCYDGESTKVIWPCSINQDTIRNYQGYSYFAEHMASHGYVVISISANAAVVHGYPDIDMQQRAELIQHHLEQWQAFNTTGVSESIDFFESEFNLANINYFEGKLNLNNIGLMGHSRGGEGVVHYSNSIQNPSFGVRAILTLAPTNFFREVITNIPTMNISPYCAGDVPDLGGVRYYDDSRYSDLLDTVPKHNLLMWGANHNYFNTIWTPDEDNALGAVDDAETYSSDEHCGSTSGRLTAEQQRAAFTAYSSAFFRTYMNDDDDDDPFIPLLTVKRIDPPSSSMVSNDEIFMSYHPPAAERLDINRTDLQNSDLMNTLGGSVSTDVFSSATVSGCGYDYDSRCGSPYSGQYPHSTNSISASEIVYGLKQLKIGWDSFDARFDNAIPSQFEDFSNYQYIQFRVAVDVESNLNNGENLDFFVELTDEDEDTSFLLVSHHSNALLWPPGNTSIFPRVMHNTVMLPLNEFKHINCNLDLEKITNVGFRFDAPLPNGSTSGSIFLTDLMLSSPTNCNLAISLNGLPIVTSSNTPITLSGCPAGGTFSGPGVLFSGFNPSIAGPGTHTVTYTYDDGNGCSESVSQNIIYFEVIYNFVQYNLGTVSPRLDGSTFLVGCGEKGEMTFELRSIDTRNVKLTLIQESTGQEILLQSKLSWQLGSAELQKEYIARDLSTDYYRLIIEYNGSVVEEHQFEIRSNTIADEMTNVETSEFNKTGFEKEVEDIDLCVEHACEKNDEYGTLYLGGISNIARYLKDNYELLVSIATEGGNIIGSAYFTRDGSDIEAFSTLSEGAYELSLSLTTKVGSFTKVLQTLSKDIVIRNNCKKLMTRSFIDANSDISEIDLTVFPNPVKSKATILLQAKFFDDNTTILVYDINGRE